MSTHDPYAIWTPSSNCWPARMGYKPRWIIIHGTAGGGSVSWLTNPDSQVSAHYVVMQDGKIYQLVDEESSAWANGDITAGHDSWWTSDTNPNLTTISIEHEKPDTGNNAQLTSAQSLASFQLISRICKRWNIPAQRADADGGITGHYSIDPVNRSHCPGPYPWQGLYDFLAQENGDSLKMLSLSDSMGKFFVQVDANHWHCNNTNATIAYAHLEFYRKFEGVFGLPLTNEIYLAQLPGTAIQVYERCIAIYDPKFVSEGSNPATKGWGGGCYLMRIDRGIGAQIVAKPLLLDLQAQIADLQKQLAQHTDSSEMDALRAQIAAYQKAIATIRATAATV